MLLVINVLTKFSLKKELGRLNAMVICFVYFVGFYEMGRIMLQNYIPVYSLTFFRISANCSKNISSILNSATSSK